MSTAGRSTRRGRWSLALDFGTTSTAAAMAYGGQVSLARIDGELRMPSTVFWREQAPDGTGTLILGAEAENWAAADPACLERAPKRRLGDDTFRLGHAQLSVVEVIGAVLRRAASAAIEQRGGGQPDGVCLTYPVRWGEKQLDRLRDAARAAGLPEVQLLEEPIAAAVHFGSTELDPGSFVAVYDLGGGTFDTAVLRRTEDGFEIVGAPGGDQAIGGDDFDDRLYRHVGRQLTAEGWLGLTTSQEQAWRQANRALQREVRRAKEALSGASECPIYIPPPVDRQLLITAPELEALISEPIETTVDELERTIVDAGVSPSEVAGIYLAGGSSRIPLVTRMIGDRLGIVPKRLDDPKAVVVLGAARAIADGTAQAGGADRGRSVFTGGEAEADEQATVPEDADRTDPDLTERVGEADGPPPEDPERNRSRRPRALLARPGLRVASGALALAVLGVVVALLLMHHKPPPPPHPKPNPKIMFADGSTEAPASLTSALTSIPASVYDRVPYGYGSFDLPDDHYYASTTPNHVLLFAGEESCPYCEAISWPLVVALSRFGTFSHLATVNSGDYESTDQYTPGFSMYGSSYSSSYIDFLPRELDTNTGATFQTMAGYNASLYERDAPDGPPFLDFGGGFVLDGPDAVFDPGALDGRTYAQIANAIRSPSSSLGEDILGEANVITADICDMTDGAPARVCDDSTIKDVFQNAEAASSS